MVSRRSLVKNNSAACSLANPVGLSSSRGFTLLEMMLTIALIAITATFVSLGVSRSDARLVELEARRFVALVNMALDESIMTGRPILLTVNAESNHYQFAPMDVPGIFMTEADEFDQLDESADEQEGGAADYVPEDDPFFEPRQMPERVKMDFTRLPDRPKPEDDYSNMVPQRVHEILNESLFDEERDEIEGPQQNTVLIEPAGLISPFELALSMEDKLSRVGLDAFGKAVVLEKQ